MKRFILLSVLCLVLLTAAVSLSFLGMEGQDLLRRCRDRHPFSAAEMTFASTGRTLFERGLILNHPTFPAFPVRQTVDRLTIFLKPGQMRMRLSGVTADLARTLTERKGISLMDSFRHIETPVDLVTHPVEASVLLKQDIFRGTVDITVQSTTHGTQVMITLLYRNRKQMMFRTLLDREPGRGLWDWTRVPFRTVHLTIWNPILIRALAGYFPALNREVPDSLKQAVGRPGPYQTIIHSDRPISLADIFTDGREHGTTR